MDAQIIDLLKQDGPLHIGTIAERTNAHPYQVEKCCARLFRQGHVTTESCGVYRLTPSGRRYGDAGGSPSPAD